EYVADLVEVYRRRRDTMIGALREHFPEQATWTEPEGGMFIWATLPEYIDTGDLLAKALRSDVAFVPGQAAYVDGRGKNSMRLNFSGVSDEEIREGIQRIGRVIREQVELYEALAPRQTAAPAESSPGTPGREAEDVPVDETRPNPRPSQSDSSEADSVVVPFRQASGGGKR
ncbi:MAG TPA: aminotransferase class I/II-fold pyridoxal phosphate-dependent enzyme, partial [Solirubrobacterales bacterium]|nr:aminotransferase class I/II-fold pyridoxal phosphate-dependent enzyme [Solirubrobacterales bacterium]